MSKKFYMAPECEEILIKTEGFLAASTDIDEDQPVPMGGGSSDEEDDGFNS